MKVQVNSNRSIVVDDALIRFVESAAERILGPLAAKVTRVEVHVSDVSSRRTGPGDKRCVVEVRPAGGRPLSVTAATRHLESAILQALRKMQRALRSYFGRHGQATGRAGARPAAARPAAVTTPAPTKVRTAPKVKAKTKSQRKAAAAGAVAEAAAVKAAPTAKAPTATKTRPVTKTRAAKEARAAKTRAAAKTPVVKKVEREKKAKRRKGKGATKTTAPKQSWQPETAEGAKGRGPRKGPMFQARRKAWPSR